MITAVGQLFDELGLARAWRDAQLQHWSTPLDGIRIVQPTVIRVKAGHGYGVVGQIAHLERAGRHLWGVAALPGDEVDPAELPALYFSGETDSDRSGRDTVITGVGLVERTAQTGTRAVRFLPGDLDDVIARGRWKLPPLERQLVEHAVDTVRRRRRDGGPIVVAGAERDRSEYEHAMVRSRRGRPWVHPGGRILDVH